MAGIKISDLPPNSLPLVGDEQMELENADGNSTRATVADIASSASGLDATFITVSANAALPNERVLTAGTNISLVDTGPNGTLTINAAGLSFPLLAPDGSVGAPSYSFASDPDSGMYLNGVGELSFAADGVEIARAINGAQNQFAIAQSGSSSVPDFTSLADLDTGFRFPANNETVWIGGGSRAWNFSTAKFYSQFSNGPALMNEISSDTNPTLVPDHSDPNTGIGHPSGSDELSIIAGGVEAVRVDETAGAIQVIIDPGLTNTSDAAPPLAFGGGTVGFRSPDSDQIFVILSGVSRWHFTTVDFHANITDGPALRFVTPSGTVPSVLPNFNDIDTGIGQNAADDLSLIGGGVELARTITAATGGMLVNNTLTGAGLERVLTISDAFAGVPDPLLLSDGSAAAPSYSFAADTDIGMFRVGADILGLSARSTLIAQAVGALGANQFVVAPGAVQNNVSAPDLGFGDGDTGVMQTVDDTIALVAGANLAVRYAEAGAGIIQVNASGTGLVASVTQTQVGGLALIDSYNEVSTVANSGDALTAFAVAQGSRLTVINNGANDLQLFPDVGDDFGAGVDTAITIAAGELGIFLGRGSTNWDTLYNAASTPTFSVPDPLLLSLGSAGAPTYSFASDPDTGIFSFGSNTILFSAGGTARFIINSTEFAGVVAGAPLIRNLAASSTVPNITISSGDVNTGIGTAAADQLSLIAGGVEIARAVEAVGADQLVILPADATPGTAANPALQLGSGANGFFLPFTNQISAVIGGVDAWKFTAATLRSSTPTTGPGLVNAGTVSLTSVGLAPLADNIGTGVGSDGANTLSLVVDDRIAVLYDEATGRIVQTNSSEIGLTASVTQTQAGGLLLRSSYNEIATVANVNDAITAFAVAQAMRLVVVNNGANDLQLFPAVGDDFGAGVDTAITIASGAIGVFLGRTAVIWDTLYNALPSPGGGGGGLPEFQFAPLILENPNSADWTVNALAPAVADSNNAGLTVRLFDDTTEEGVGFSLEVPLTASNIIFTFRSRAETAPGIVNTVGLDIYNRGIPDDAAVQAWSAATQLTDISIPTNENFQEDSQTVALGTLGLTAGELTQFELVRTTPTGGTDLTGDWVLGNLKVSFS